MAAPGHAFTIRRAAELLGCGEELLWTLLGQIEPEDGMMWVYDTGDAAVPAFTELGIETLREIIRDQFGNAA